MQSSCSWRLLIPPLGLPPLEQRHAGSRQQRLVSSIGAQNRKSWNRLKTPDQPRPLTPPPSVAALPDLAAAAVTLPPHTYPLIFFHANIHQG